MKFRSYFDAWYQVLRRYELGEITKEEYDHWRYTYPEVLSQEFKDHMDASRGIKKK